jgi:hypothetical protein
MVAELKEAVLMGEVTVQDVLLMAALVAEVVELMPDCRADDKGGG